MPNSATIYAGAGKAEGLILPLCVLLCHMASNEEPSVFQSFLASELLQMSVKFPDPHFYLDFFFAQTHSEVYVQDITVM